MWRVPAGREDQGKRSDFFLYLISGIHKAGFGKL
jgi:hypothetical protein